MHDGSSQGSERPRDGKSRNINDKESGKDVNGKVSGSPGSTTPSAVDIARQRALLDSMEKEARKASSDGSKTDPSSTPPSNSTDSDSRSQSNNSRANKQRSQRRNGRDRSGRSSSDGERRPKEVAKEIETQAGKVSDSNSSTTSPTGSAESATEK
jgi:hypothetical protein